MAECCELRHKVHPRSEQEIKTIKNRVNRCIGQLEGINRMLDDNRYCGDILIQIAAVESALQQIGYIVLENHMKSCVKDDIKNDDLSSLDEAIKLLKKLK